jgi:ATP-dependent Lon protease
MYTIEIPGYNNKDKLFISQNYLIPSIVKDIGLQVNDIVIPSDILSYIIDITKPEEGVRNLKRNLEIIYSKLNLFRLMKPEKNLFDDQIKLQVTFPYTLDKSNVDKLIKKNETVFNFRDMYV